jgi:SagB-type dehydrogenase family enzyme
MAASLEQYRAFLKDAIRLRIDFSKTAQHRGLPAPPIEKPFDPHDKRVKLVPIEDLRDMRGVDLACAIRGRRSHRRYTADPLTLRELSFLLWATQGIRDVRDAGTAFRVVPSAGCRHALETYLCVLRVDGLDVGLYRYLPVEHQLLLVRAEDALADEISAAALGQSFAGTSAVTFVWTAVPYRMEWRYDLAAHKVIALDAGHVCQNLYLACAAIGAGCCAVAAYHQEQMDQLLGVDGVEEFALYLAPVGKV